MQIQVVDIVTECVRMFLIGEGLNL